MACELELASPWLRQFSGKEPCVWSACTTCVSMTVCEKAGETQEGADGVPLESTEVWQKDHEQERDTRPPVYRCPGLIETAKWNLKLMTHKQFASSFLNFASEKEYAKWFIKVAIHILALKSNRLKNVSLICHIITLLTV